MAKIAENMVLTTAGGSGWSYFDIRVQELDDIGPDAESFTLHVDIDQLTTDGQVKLVHYWSIAGREWEGPYDVCSAISIPGQSIRAPYTTTANFGVKMRFAFAVQDSVSTASKTAVIQAAYLVVQLVS